MIYMEKLLFGSFSGYTHPFYTQKSRSSLKRLKRLLPLWDTIGFGLLRLEYLFVFRTCRFGNLQQSHCLVNGYIQTIHNIADRFDRKSISYFFRLR